LCFAFKKQCPSKEENQQKQREEGVEDWKFKSKYAQLIVRREKDNQKKQSGKGQQGSNNEKERVK